MNASYSERTHTATDTNRRAAVSSRITLPLHMLLVRRPHSVVAMATALPLYCAVLCAFLPASLQHATRQGNSYVAAVVEYAALGDPATEAPLDIIRRNFEHYSEYIQEAARQSADIIVFPECGLTSMDLPTNRSEIRAWLTRVPEPSAGVNPCSSTEHGVPEILRNVSCAARDHSLYVLINLSEEAACSAQDPRCPSDGAFFYNTNVVFDRGGTIVARYRKFNLFVEPGFDVTPTAELVTFDTDFGVRFGTFICFDLLFHDPAVQLVRELGVTDIAFSTAWFSELPYLTAVQVQAGWSHALDVNLLASGFNNPPNGNSGSGLYAGTLGALDAVMPLNRTSRMLVRTVLKKARHATPAPGAASAVPVATAAFPPPWPLPSIPTSTIGELRFFQDDFREYTTVLLDTEVAATSSNSTRNKNIELCHGEFCCHFDVTTETLPAGGAEECFGEPSGGQGGYYYRLGVFDGIRNFAGVSVAGVQVCGVIPCAARDVGSCGRARDGQGPPGRTVFKAALINGAHFQRRGALQMPATLLQTVLPLPASAFHFAVRRAAQQDRSQVELSAATEIRDLLGLAVYGRVFARDGPTPTPPPPPTTSGAV